MSIVVKGAKMPNNCGACPLRLAWCTQRLYMITRPERCPLEPVRKGKWVKAERRGCVTYSDAYAECSYCHGEPTFLGWRMKFCPDCGARMSEGEEE